MLSILHRLAIARADGTYRSVPKKGKSPLHRLTVFPPGLWQWVYGQCIYADLTEWQIH